MTSPAVDFAITGLMLIIISWMIWRSFLRRPVPTSTRP
jgi:hypothetical protein